MENKLISINENEVIVNYVLCEWMFISVKKNINGPVHEVPKKIFTNVQILLQISFFLSQRFKGLRE